MAIVRATCPTCGDVEMSVLDVQVQVCVSNTAATYSFLCPACRFIVNKHASGGVVESLTRAGAPMLAWSLPAELQEPKFGPPINHDDLLEFQLSLESGAWRQELATLTLNG